MNHGKLGNFTTPGKVNRGVLFLHFRSSPMHSVDRVARVREIREKSGNFALSGNFFKSQEMSGKIKGILKCEFTRHTG